MPHLPELPLGNVPRTAYHRSHGLVRVVGYHGNGRFSVITSHDERAVVHRSTLSFRKEKPVAKSDRDRRVGSAMTGAGAVTGGTGLLAGGIPGAKEPDWLNVWLLRSRGSGHRPLAPRNVAHNAKTAAKLPRAGILGFRADAHDSYIREQQHKTTSDPYVRGMREGKLGAEHQIVRGMRLGRKASYPLTIGGAALAAAGIHRRNQANGKADHRRSVAAGAGGAAGGTVAGAYLGLRGGAEAAVKLVNRRIRREHTPGAPFSTGDRMVRRIAALERGVKVGTTTGAATLGYTGYRLARGRKVSKASSDRQDASAAAVGAGLATAGVGHFVPKPLRRYERRYANSARDHVLAAQSLAPHFGGVQVIPAKHGPFGNVVRPERVTMHPEISDRTLRENKASQRIRGSKAGSAAQIREQVGRHRGIAAQERHFAEVFNSTGRAVRRARGPGLALAGAGATGLWASQGRKGTKQTVHKAAEYGYMDKHRAPIKTAEMLAGIGLLAHGGSRLKMWGPAAAKGVKLADKHGAGKEARAALELAAAFGAKTRDVTGRGETQLRRIRTLDNAVRSVPASVRPEIATAAGALLAAHAHPTTKERFTPLGGY